MIDNRDSAKLQIRVFGGVSLSVSGRDVRLGNRRARALIAYLALSETGKERRERLANLFWGENSERNARGSLRQVLFDARDTLQSLGYHALLTERDHVELTVGSIELDVATVLQDITSGTVPEVLLTQPRATEGLLAGYEDLGEAFAAWLLALRQTTQMKLTRALEANYIHLSLPRRQRRSMAEAALRLDPLDEAACRVVMQLAAEDGEIGPALKVYTALYEELDRELDMEPSVATQELVARIKQGTLDPVAPINAVTTLEVGSAPPSLSSSGAPVVAVMPFRSVGPDPVPDYFAEGVLEDTVCMLTSLREPIVISSNSTRSFRSQTADPREVGQRLGAQYVVTGMMRKAGPRVRLSVQLAEVERGTVLWAAPYDAPEPGLFETQADIASKIAHTLVPRLRDAELRHSRSHRPESLTAYHLMIQARARLPPRARGVRSSGRPVATRHRARSRIRLESRRAGRVARHPHRPGLVTRPAAGFRVPGTDGTAGDRARLRQRSCACNARSQPDDSPSPIRRGADTDRPGARSFAQ